MLHYLAYGSNLHPLRLRQRVPSCRLLGKVELKGYRLAFHKRGQDNSGKCNLVKTKQLIHAVHAAIFHFHADEKILLDAYEGGGYRSEETTISLNGNRLRAYMYLAEPECIDHQLHPYHWYKQLVLRGAQYQGFPKNYLDAIVRVRSEEDPDPSRRKINRLLLAEIHRSKKTYR